MILIGLTGGIGAGKTFLSDVLVQKRIPVIDTDIIARQLLEPHEAAWSSVKDHFGNSFFSTDGHLDRSKLAKLIFSDAASKKWLNELMHPMIRQRWRHKVKKLQEIGEQISVVVIPLLFETKAHSEFDKIICMACSPQTQFNRLINRGWDRSHIESRIAAQWSMSKKMSESHFVIWTDCSKDSTQSQCDLVLERVTN